MTDTQPFMDEARDLCNCVAKAFNELEELDVAAAPLATALSSAYQRGREEERERCVKIVLDWQKHLTRGERIDWHAERIAAAIRSAN